MNKDIVEGKWKQLKGEAQKQWGKLTDDDFDKIAGQRAKFAGKVQSLYGKSKEEAEKEFDSFCKRHNC
ncbi:CsbD family protein [Pseudomaricurvus alcaniphilus]|uniref:CsbD family protein n=1 Tax=Pseudomaricurvus alcaniphilus TaxID=1166482 RepID=UPI00140ADDC5|nr:CsbD family protein [Pseudomaricurvus alcaniphilus]NHN38403.1 CsbD family protein [Pseudomaricurvus alcaniphilus]